MVAAGCAKAKAAPLPESPPLVMPAPPARVLAPIEEEPIASAPAILETPATNNAPRTPPQRNPGRTTARTEPSAPAEPAPAPVAQVAPPEPPKELRSLDAAAEQNVRDLLGRASRDLSRVDYQKLSMEGRAQYDQSKRFSDQADQALKERNTVFAATLADKAAVLAAELLSR
jgi:hypothetical protein